MKLARAAVCSILGLTALGCADDPELVIVIEHPTLIEVNPSEFLGNVPCLEAEGAMRRYVATVFDVTPLETEEQGAGGAGGELDGPAENFALPSSGPSPCTAPIATAFVLHGRRYAAEIDGYDRADIEPLATGARVMVDRETGTIVEPRWTTSCGREPGQSVVAIYQATRPVSHCAALQDHAPTTGEPRIVVGLEDALGELECGSEPGQIARFEVREPLSGTSAEAACSDLATLAVDGASGSLELELRAYEEAQTAPSWGALCSATPFSGVSVEAVCDELVAEGALDVDLSDLGCDEELREIVLDPGGDLEPRVIAPSGCEDILRVSDLPPGAITVSVSTTLATGDPGPALSCSGTVVPGLTVPAKCVPAASN